MQLRGADTGQGMALIGPDQPQRIGVAVASSSLGGRLQAVMDCLSSVVPIGNESAISCIISCLQDDSFQVIAERYLRACLPHFDFISLLILVCVWQVWISAGG